MTAPYKLVDAFLQMPQLSRRAQEQILDPNIAKWFKPGDAVKHGFTLDELLHDMEATGVEKGVLTAAALRLSPSPYSVGQNISDETYEKLCTRFARSGHNSPDAFTDALASIRPG